MSYIVMVVETAPIDIGGPDPALVDPHEIAEQMIDDNNECCVVAGEHTRTVKFVSAEWKES